MLSIRAFSLVCLGATLLFIRESLIDTGSSLVRSRSSPVRSGSILVSSDFRLKSSNSGIGVSSYIPFPHVSVLEAVIRSPFERLCLIGLPVVLGEKQVEQDPV